MTPAKTSVHPALAADPKIQRNAALHMGLDIGGTNLRLGVFRGLRLLSEYRTAPDLSEVCRHAGNREDAQRLVVRLVDDAIADALCKHKQVQHIGMGIPGFVDPGNSLLLQSPNLQHLENTDLISPLQKRFSLPVCLVNDANAAAYGEYLLARPHHSDLRHLLYVGLGTGIGGGLVLNGQVYPGAHGSALEIGHLIVEPNGRVCGCGNRGCLEQYASASGVKLSYTEYTGCHKTARDIGQMADAGDRSARQAFWQAGRALGQALAHLQKILDVELVCIGGGLIGSWPWMAPAVQSALDADLIPILKGRTRITLSSSADCAGMLGAAYIGLETAEVPHDE